jgi:PAS domain S-box-containing protein
MADFFKGQMDYILFFYGLAFIMLSVVCFMMTRAKEQRLPWVWLALFGITHGLHEWLGIFDGIFGDRFLPWAISPVLLVSSYFALAEFGRLGLREVRGRGPGKWILAPLLLLVIVAGIAGGSGGAEAASRFFLGLPAGMLSSYVLVLVSREEEGAAKRWLIFGAALLVAYAFLTAVSSGSFPRLSALGLSNEAFLDTIGLPVELIRGLLAFLLVLSVWVYAQTQSAEPGHAVRRPKNTLLPVLILLLILAAGWVLTEVSGRQAGTEVVKEGALYMNALSEHLDYVLEDAATTALSKAESPIVVAALDTRNPDDLAEAKLLLDERKPRKGADRPFCYLLDKQGNLVLSSDRGGKAGSAEMLPDGARQYLKVRHPAVFQYYAVDRSANMWSYFAGSPVRDGRGRVIGTIVVEKNLAAAEAMFRTHPYCFLIDPHGVIFLSSDEHYCLKSLWPLDKSTRQKRYLSGMFGNGPFPALLAEEAFNGRYSSFEGRRFLVNRAPVGDEGWSIVLLTSTGLIKAYRTFSILTTFFFFSLTVFFFSLMYFARESSSTIAASERRYRGLVEGSPNGVALFGPGGECLAVNRSGLDMIGMTEQDVIGKSIDSLWSGHDALVGEATVARVLGGERVSFEQCFLRPDGRRMVWNVIMNPIRDPEGGPQYFVGLFIDITALKLAAESLQKAKDELETRVEERTAELAHVNEKLMREIAERKLSERALKVSEEKYKNLIELTPDIISLSDIDGHVIFINKACRRILDAPPEEVTGKSLVDWVHPDDREMTSRKFSHILEKGEDVFDFENRFLSRTGRVVHTLHNIRVIKSERGEIIGTQAVIRDVTTRKLAEEALREHDRQQKAILGNIPDMAWLKDREHRFIATNESFGNACGIFPADLTGKTDFDIWPHHLAEKYRADDTEVMETGQRKQTEELVIDHEGRKIWLETIKTPIYNDSGEVIGTTGIGRDITERKRTEEKLKLFSQAIEEAMDGVQIVSPDGRVLYSNRAAQDIYGFSGQELIGSDVDALNADPGFAAKEIIPEIRDKGCWSGEVMVVHKTGRTLPIWLSASMVKDSKGAPIAVVGFMRDITERKKAEEELRRHREHLVEMVEERTMELQTAVQFLTQEIGFRKKAEETLREREAKFRELSQQFNTLLDAIPDVLLLLSSDLKVLWANSSAKRRLGEKVPEMKGMYCYELWHDSCSPCEDCHVIRTFRTGEAAIAQRAANGRLFDSKAFPIKDDEGRVTNAIIVISDITERMTLEAEAMRASHLASLGELAAGVAHEINNPINGIINYAQMIVNKSAAGTKQREIAGRVIKEGNRIAGIVRSLLSFARERKEEKSAVNVRRALYETITLMEAQIRKDGIQLNVDVPEYLPPVIANPQQLQQVFLNVVSNARYALNKKYPTADKEKILTISCEQTRMKDCPCLEITFFDHGPGIHPDIIDKVMNPFFTTKPSGEGTGLGLSISHGIVKDHGGRLILESEEGVFTKVSVYLPVKEENGK